MNTPNPLVPQGSRLEQKSNARSRVKLAVFFVLSIHVVGLMALLVQGCRPEPQTVEEQPVPAPELPPFEPVMMVQDTNEVLLPPVSTPPPEGTPWTEPAPYGGNTVTPPVDPVTPTPVITPVDPVAPVMQEYIIAKGDTYYSIGRKFGVSMQAIGDANPNVDPKRLQVGKTIYIPPPTAAPAAVAPATVPGEVIYTVVSGDTLSRIAEQHGTTWKAIYDLNNLRTTNIKVGQKLKIPAPKPASGGAGGF